MLMTSEAPLRTFPTDLTMSGGTMSARRNHGDAGGPADADSHALGTGDLIGPINRRRFLQAGGTVGLIVAAGCVPDPGPPPPSFAPPALSQNSVPTHTARIRRRADLLNLRFDFHNLELVGRGEEQRLVRRRSNAWVVVTFPAQAVTEEVILAEPSSALPSFGELGARLSGPTRLVFHIPQGVTELAYSTDSLLAWLDWRPVLAPTGQPGPGEFGVPGWGGLTTVRPPLVAPTAGQTSIELPWWLIISPNRFARFANAVEPVTHNGRTELWHTRLAIDSPLPGDPEDPENPLRTGRAIWARDPLLSSQYLNSISAIPGENDTTNGQPYANRSAMLVRDRVDLVKATSWFTRWDARPFDIETLTLSTLGGFLAAEGAWNPPAQVGTSLRSWRHRATLGRDHFVRIVRAGFLFPFGHPVVRIDVSERKFTTRNGAPAAYLEKRSFLVVRRPLKRYGEIGHAHGGRNLPFRSLRVTTLVTPPLQFQDFAALTGEPAKLMLLDGRPYEFTFVGRDHTGRAIELTSPAVFVEDQGDGTAGPGATGLAYQIDEMTKVRDAWNALGPDSGPNGTIRSRPMGGQRIAYAREIEPNDTRLETRRLTLSADAPGQPGAAPPTAAQLEAAGQPAFFPGLASAEVRLPELEQAAGDGFPGAAPVRYDPNYLVHNTTGAGNSAGAFVRFVDDVPLGFAADRSGGVATPGIALTGVTAKLGPTGGDPDALAGGTFDPGDVFDLSSARLLGGVFLGEITAPTAIAPGTAPAPASALQFRTVEDDSATVTRLLWRPQLQDDAQGIFDSAGASLELVGLLRTDPQNPARSTTSVTGDLRNFRIRLSGAAPNTFMILSFSRVSFVAGTGSAATMDIDLTDVQFFGPLRFVKELAKYLSFLGSGFDVAVGPTSIRAGLTIAIPHIEVGALAIQTTRFRAELDLPLSGAPGRFRFAFSERHNPFRVTVLCFGGGGYIGIAIGVDGLELLEMAFEATVQLALSIGIASVRGGASLGIFFQHANDGGTDTVRFVGYLRWRCEVSITVYSWALEAYGAMEYVSKPNADILTSRVEVTYEVSLLFASKTFTLVLERNFGGDPADPTFAEFMPQQQQWDEYCDAFASTEV